MTIVLILLSVLAAFFAVVLIRTARFRPKAEPDASLPPLAEAPDAALAAEHGVTMAFSGDAALSRVTLRGPAQDVLAALQALSVYFPGKSCRISG